MYLEAITNGKGKRSDVGVANGPIFKVALSFERIREHTLMRSPCPWAVGGNNATSLSCSRVL